jgi:hypothetical protein
MIALVYYFFELLSFKVGPAEAPYAPRLLVALIALDVTLQAAGSYFFGEANPMANALLAEVVFVFGLCFCLKLRNTLARATQTLTAYSGASIVLNVLALGLGGLYQATNSPKTGALAEFFGLSLLILLLWHTAILTHLVRRAANWQTAQALPASLALTALVLMVVKLAA